MRQNKRNTGRARAISVLLVACAAICSTAAAQDQANYTQTRIGEVHKMNYAEQTAIISGYRYSFAVKEATEPVVRLLGSQYGAFQQLTPGMRVKITYHPGEKARQVVVAQQVPDDTKLGVPDVE